MAMSTDAPDPRTLQTWEDAFQYPIPVIRKLEQQLRTNADDNREKLRSLVGTSYRSLLDTAETIIDMEVRMDQVESKLSTVGQHCSSRGLERISGNASKMDSHIRSHDAERYTFASQLSLLRNIPLVMTRLMKRGGSYLLIAKLLVISRLLHKALSQAQNKLSIVDQLWERVLSVRRKLLRRIDSRISSTIGETASLVESMSAYALATSSTPSDVLNHFHRVRLDRINSYLKQGGDELATHGITALKLCIQTCLDTQTIFPRRLAESLAKLKTQPLVQDPDVRGLHELNLDVHDRWIGDETRKYTPWPRHDELHRPEAEKILHNWSKTAILSFLKGVKTVLEGEDRLNEVARLRQELIETWILSGSRMAGVKSANVLDDLRDTMNEKLESIVRSRTNKLQSIVSDLKSQLAAFSEVHDTSGLALWNTTAKAIDLSNGAESLMTTIVNTYQGRDEPVIKITSAFDSWMGSVLEVKGIIKSMKEARWDDTFADDVDGDSDDDLEGSKQTLLSDDDPRLLEEATQEALSEALQQLGDDFADVVATASAPGEKTKSIQNSIFLLRYVRGISDRISELWLQDKSTPPTSPFTAKTLRPLYTNVASFIIDPTINAHAKSLSSSNKAIFNSHILWEGNPPLPTQPSPVTFRFLRELNRSMGAVGSDLWAPGVVSVLKTNVSERLLVLFEDQLNAINSISNAEEKQGENPKNEGNEEDVKTNGEKEDRPTGDPPASVQELKERRCKQLLFDACYVQRFTATVDAESDGLAYFIEKANGAWLDGPTKTRLRKNATDYAKKTYLLFALLA
ncbi:hypothetical protein IQ07DRAFT_627560 [Pyrenochaeta sp. DS3sAY3a]|nr:hypothetical protein IQ07DRAFT_627560 [Pyrenochaeta sp. DS3sAY3a]